MVTDPLISNPTNSTNIEEARGGEVIQLEEEKELAAMVVESEAQQQNMKGRTQKKKRKKEKQQKKYRLVSYEELPEYMKENEYILGYYRAEWPIPNAILSLFSWHNETLNIWTHLVGFLVFLGLTLLHLSNYVTLVADLLGHLPWSISTSVVGNTSCNQGNFYSLGAASFLKLETAVSPHTPTSTTSPAARWPFFVFLGGAMFCLLTSSVCHLLCCHSHRLSLLLRLDYVGIAVMIVASFFPPIYYIFQCEPHWQLAYLAAITAMGCAAVFTLLSPHLSTGKFRAFRALLFAGMGLSGVVPAVHASIVNWGEPRRNVTLAYELAMAASYLTGTVFYVTRVPERWKPGWFDLAGHSHQIFHVLVTAGALAHYGAAMVFLRWRDEVGCAGTS